MKTPSRCGMKMRILVIARYYCIVLVAQATLYLQMIVVIIKVLVRQIIRAVIKRKMIMKVLWHVVSKLAATESQLVIQNTNVNRALNAAPVYTCTVVLLGSVVTPHACARGKYCLSSA